MIQGKLRWTGAGGAGHQFVAEAGGHALVLDSPEGGTGPKPTELALLALGGCTAMDVVDILRKKRQTVVAYEIELRAEQRDEFPRVFTRVEIRHKLHGQIDPRAVARAIELSETKYCSVGAMIAKSARIEATFEIVPATSSTPAPAG